LRERYLRASTVVDMRMILRSGLRSSGGTG
jgi:hypothetical protein